MFKKLIDEICNDNDYILTFQTTQEVRNLVHELIELRDDKIDNINNVYNAVIIMIERLNDDIKRELLNDNKSERVSRIDYFEEILYGLTTSQKRLDDFKLNNLKTDDLKTDDLKTDK